MTGRFELHLSTLSVCVRVSVGGAPRDVWENNYMLSGTSKWLQCCFGGTELTFISLSLHQRLDSQNAGSLRRMLLLRRLLGSRSWLKRYSPPFSSELIFPLICRCLSVWCRRSSSVDLDGFWWQVSGPEVQPIRFW